MAEAEHLDAGSQAVAHNLAEADKLEGLSSSHNATTEAAHGGEHAPDPAVFGYFNSTVVVSLAMAVFIIILLVKKVPGAIAGALDTKIEAIKAQLAEATKLRAEAEALKAEYNAKLAAFAKEAEEIRSQAEDEAKLITEKATADATDLIARRQKMAEDRIGAAERQAIASVRAKAVHAATVAAATLLAETHDAKADKSLIDDTIGKLAH